tara:strand:- start:5 stop:589 length:585 start_codon:yes stop_codon:yes gene_type:complete
MKACVFFFLILQLALANKLFCKSYDLINDLARTGKHSTLISIIEKNPLFLSILDNSVNATFYAPTDKAFQEMPDLFITDIENNNIKVTTKLILSHIFKGDNDTKNNTNESKMVLSLDGSIYFVYDIGDLFVKDIVSTGEAFKSGFFTIIPTECVMFLQPSTNDIRLDKKIIDKYKYTTCCLQTPMELEDFYRGI